MRNFKDSGRVNVLPMIPAASSSVHPMPAARTGGRHDSAEHSGCCRAAGVL